MHYHAEIYLPTNEDVEAQVKALMAPYCEHDHDNGWWDWYEIGGRWQGAHDHYDPSTDIRNYEKCWLCDGTGYRNDELGRKARADDPTYTCNGCGQYEGGWKHGPMGPGLQLKHASKWVQHAADVEAVETVRDDLTATTLILPGEVLRDEYWNGEAWVKTEFTGPVKPELAKRNITTGFLVTVDYHS